LIKSEDEKRRHDKADARRQGRIQKKQEALARSSRHEHS
jgi:hypothetical protein